MSVCRAKFGHLPWSDERKRCPVHGIAARITRRVGTVPVMPTSMQAPTFVTTDASALAQAAGLDARAITRLARHPDAHVRECIGARADAPAQVLWALGGDVELGPRVAVASNEASPAALLQELVTNYGGTVAGRGVFEARRVVSAAMSNPSIGEDFIAHTVLNGPIARSFDVLNRPHIPEVILLHMYARATGGSEFHELALPDLNVALAKMLGARADVPELIQAKLAASHYTSVRTAVAGNLAVDDAVAGPLRADPEAEVRDAASKVLPQRIARRFGIAEDNTTAVRLLGSKAWWTLTADSPEVAVAKRISGER